MSVRAHNPSEPFPSLAACPDRRVTPALDAGVTMSGLN